MRIVGYDASLSRLKMDPELHLVEFNERTNSCWNVDWPEEFTTGAAERIEQLLLSARRIIGIYHLKCRTLNSTSM